MWGFSLTFDWTLPGPSFHRRFAWIKLKVQWKKKAFWGQENHVSCKKYKENTNCKDFLKVILLQTAQTAAVTDRNQDQTWFANSVLTAANAVLKIITRFKNICQCWCSCCCCCLCYFATELLTKQSSFGVLMNPATGLKSSADSCLVLMHERDKKWDLCDNQSGSRSPSGCSVWSCCRQLWQSGVAHPATTSVDCSFSFLFFFYCPWKRLFGDFQADAVEHVRVRVCIPCPAWTSLHLALAQQGHLNARQAAVSS